MRRADRGGHRSRRRSAGERRIAAPVVAVLVTLALATAWWRPWAGSGVRDTGASALGADRVALTLVVSDASGALATAILEQDRRGQGHGALVGVPAELALPVEGFGRLTAHQALAQAGPTLSRNALSSLVGVSLAGSWVIGATDFVTLIDRLGGLRVGGASTDGRTALARAGADPDGAREVFEALVRTFPAEYGATRTLLVDLGILDSPDLPVRRLAAVLAALAHDATGGHLRTGTLPLDASGHALAPAALPLIRDVLGGTPGRSRAEATPRVLVSIAPGADVTESDVAADVLGAGYDYLVGPAAPVGALSAVVVRAGVPDARRVGADVAELLNLPASVVRVGDDVPFPADVAVVLAGRSPSPGPARAPTALP